MYIDVDYNPTPSNQFFISVGLTDKEAISFDYTIKGQRVAKQTLLDKKSSEQVSSENEHISSEWDVLEIKDGQFLNKRHVQWIDKGKIDEVDGEVWNTEWAKSMSDDVKENLLSYSQYISDNYTHLDTEKMKEFEEYIGELIIKYK